MSGSNNPTRSSTNPANTVSDPHINGHLVCTGMYEFDRVIRLYIHKSSECTKFKCLCQVFSYDASIPAAIDHDEANFSQDHTIEEHGWFRDVTTFGQICRNHPVLNGQPTQHNFINWRDSLLAMLDNQHGGAGDQWTRAN